MDKVSNVPLRVSVTLYDCSCNHGNCHQFPPVYREAFGCHGDQWLHWRFFVLLQCWNKTLWASKGDIVVHKCPREIHLKSSTGRPALSGDMFISWVSLPSLVVGVDAFSKGGGVLGVHLEETDFYVLILWCEEEETGRVGVRHEDRDTLLSVLELQRELEVAVSQFRVDVLRMALVSTSGGSRVGPVHQVHLIKNECIYSD